jgi:hypothetical protein
MWSHKKHGLAKGSYNVKRGNRHFTLTNLKSGKTRVYESPFAAKKDNWVYTK